MPSARGAEQAAFALQILVARPEQAAAMLECGAVRPLVRALQHSSAYVAEHALGTLCCLILIVRQEAAAEFISAGGLDAAVQSTLRSDSVGYLVFSLGLLVSLGATGDFEQHEAIASHAGAMQILVAALQPQRLAPAKAQQLSALAAEAFAQLLACVPCDANPGDSEKAGRQAADAGRLDAYCLRIAASGAVPLLASLFERCNSPQLLQRCTRALKLLSTRKSSARELVRLGVLQPVMRVLQRGVSQGRLTIESQPPLPWSRL